MTDVDTVLVPLADDHPFVMALHEFWGFAPDTFAEHRFWHRTDSGSVWLARRELTPPTSGGIETVGIAVARGLHEPHRMAAGFSRRFGRAVTRGLITLDATTVGPFVRAEPIPWPADVPKIHYCLVAGPIPGGPRHAILGRGRLEHDQLMCEMPKEARYDLPDEPA